MDGYNLANFSSSFKWAEDSQSLIAKINSMPTAMRSQLIEAQANYAAAHNQLTQQILTINETYNGKIKKFELSKEKHIQILIKEVNTQQIQVQEAYLRKQAHEHEFKLMEGQYKLKKKELQQVIFHLSELTINFDTQRRALSQANQKIDSHEELNATSLELMLLGIQRENIERELRSLRIPSAYSKALQSHELHTKAQELYEKAIREFHQKKEEAYKYFEIGADFINAQRLQEISNVYAAYSQSTSDLYQLFQKAL